MKKRFLIICVLLFLLSISGCSVFYEAAIKSLEQDIISAELLDLAEGYREIYEKAKEEDLDTLLVTEKIMEYIGEAGYSVVDMNHQLDMINSESIELFCSNAENGSEDQAVIVVVMDSGQLQRYDLNASETEIQVTETILSWENENPYISYTHSYEAAAWKYTENGYLFWEEYHPEGYDGAPGQVGIRVQPLDSKCREYNQKYVLPLGYEGNNLLITNWSESDFSDLNLYDLYEQMYKMKYQKKLPYEDSVICVEYQIPEHEFEDVLYTYLNISSEEIRCRVAYAKDSQTYQYHPRTMYDANIPYTPFPEVVSYEEMPDGTVKLMVKGIWIKSLDDNAWFSELVIRPLENGGFQYVSNRVIRSSENISEENVPWYTPRLTDAKWKSYAEESGIMGSDIGEPDVINDEMVDSENGENGYDLSVPDGFKECAEEECLQMMYLIQDIYKNVDKGAAINAVISRENVSQMLSVIAETGAPSMADAYNLNMENYESVNEFLINAQNGIEGSIVLYNILTGGGISRKEFSFKDGAMYLLGTTAVWNQKNQPSISHTVYNRLETWKYTEKGWFIYEYCIPELSDRVNGNDMFRVIPLENSFRELCERYLASIGYQGNNLLCSNWESGNMENLDYNGLFQYLYEIKTGEDFDSAVYMDGVPKEEFENIMQKYLPVSKAEVEQYAVFDSNTQKYVWKRVGYSSTSNNFFSTSFPEIVDIQEKKDGTMILTVDAVCNLLGDDTVIRHELTIRFMADGSVFYLSNKILDNGLEKIPEYQYRLGR